MPIGMMCTKIKLTKANKRRNAKASSMLEYHHKLTGFCDKLWR